MSKAVKDYCWLVVKRFYATARQSNLINSLLWYSRKKA